MAKKKDSEPSVKTSIVLPENLHWELKRLAVDKKLSDTAAIREAIQQWIERGGGSGGALKPKRALSS